MLASASVPGQPQTRAAGPPALALAALPCLTLGAVLGYGNPAVGVVLVVAALALTVLAALDIGGRGEVWALLSVVLFTAMLVLLADLPAWTFIAAPVAGGAYRLALRSRWWWFGALPALALQVAVLQQRWHWGRAAIDVFDTLQSATRHLLQGQNPYFFQYKDLAPQPKWHLVMAPFQYGPAALYLDVPGRLLGDVRVLTAAAAALTGVALVLIARRRGRAQLQQVSFLVASLPLFAPMIVNAWVDVYTAAGLAVWWLLRERQWLAGSIILGIGAAAKPVMLVGLLPFLVWDRTVRRDAVVAAGAGLLLCVPFLVWTGPVKFIYAVAGVHVQVLNEIWPTSVTFNALLLKAHLPTIPDAVSVAVLLASIPTAMLWRPTRQDVRLLIAVAFMLAALLLSKQSFLNYYYVVVIWLLLAIAERPAAAHAAVDALHEGSPPTSRIAGGLPLRSPGDAGS